MYRHHCTMQVELAACWWYLDFELASLANEFVLVQNEPLVATRDHSGCARSIKRDDRRVRRRTSGDIPEHWLGRWRDGVHSGGTHHPAQCLHRALALAQVVHRQEARTLWELDPLSVQTAGGWLSTHVTSNDAREWPRTSSSWKRRSRTNRQSHQSTRSARSS